ncbi:MAG: hypothetical protein R3F59_38765, partial [Myxococcota bacterium]
MNGRPALQSPLDLGLAEAVDPFTVQPGIILFDRFCALGQVRHAADTWRVEVTDLRRQLGSPPHHRLMMHVIPANEGLHRVLRAALPAHAGRSARIDAVVSMRDAVCVLTPHSGARPIQLPVEHYQALSVGRSLARLLVRLHDVGMVGTRFDLRDLRLDLTGEIQLTSVHHLIGLRTDGSEDDERADAAALLVLLRSIEDPAIDRALEGVMPTAQAIADRLDQIPRRRQARARAVDTLPAIPPFVGR